VLFLATTVTAYTTCQTGIVCTNSTHFKMCVIFTNGSISLVNESTACPPNTICDLNRCMDLNPNPFNLQDSRRCSNYGFICVSSYEYQLCRYDQQLYSYPWGQYYRCPINTVCNETYAYHCHAPYTPSQQPPPIGFYPQQPPPAHQPPPIGFYPPQQPQQPRQDDCKSKSFVCVDNKSYLLCRDMGDGTYRPYSQQYQCPGTQICHKSFDKPCAVEKSGGRSVYSQKWEVLAVLVFLQVVYYRCIRLY
jgi:hypothetical protein